MTERKAARAVGTPLSQETKSSHAIELLTVP